VRYEKRTNKNGYSYYSFVFFDANTKKRVRFSKDEIQERFGKDITTIKEADKALKLLEAEVDSEKVRKKYLLRWKEKYYSFNKLLLSFIELQKKDAPRSWKNSQHYMQYYVLPFFLNIKECNNILLWSKYSDEFKLWLENEASCLGGARKVISYSSKNHSIKAYNKFLSHLYDQDVISKYKKIKPFPDHLLNEKDASNIITEKEFEVVLKNLETLGYFEEAVFFALLYNTGMRLGEAVGISLGDIFPKHTTIEGDIGLWLKQHNIDHKAFIVLQSQLDYKNQEGKGKTHRVPLKSKKKIGGKSGTRIIPITCNKLWKKLLFRLALEEKNWKDSKLRKSERKRFFLFDTNKLSSSTFNKRLRRAFELSNLPIRTAHDARHSYGSFLYGRTQSKELCKLVMGHSSEKVFSKYNHVHEMMEREIRSGFEDDTFCWSECLASF
jgi:integrase